MAIRSSLESGASRSDALWRFLDAVSLHPWASKALLTTPDVAAKLTVPPMGLSEEGLDSRRQALGNFAKALSGDADAKPAHDAVYAAWRASF